MHKVSFQMCIIFIVVVITHFNMEAFQSHKFHFPAGFAPNQQKKYNHDFMAVSHSHYDILHI